VSPVQSARAGPAAPVRDQTTVFMPWLAWSTAGEVAGFVAPAVVGALTVGAPAWAGLPLLFAAGALEGAALGWAQGRVLHRVVPALVPARFAAATALAAVVAYVVVMVPVTFQSRLADLPRWVLATGGVVLGGVLLGSIGVAQWVVLRRLLRSCLRWVPATAAAWAAGLSVFMLVAPPLWHDGQAPAAIIAVGVLAGLAMALTMSVVTGWALVHLLRRNGFRVR
jgi:hypothetical protein